MAATSSRTQRPAVDERLLEVVEQLAERSGRLEAAVAQLAYLHHGPRGMAMLRRQAPAVAELLGEWLDRSQPASDQHFAGRETTQAQSNHESR